MPIYIYIYTLCKGTMKLVKFACLRFIHIIDIHNGKQVSDVKVAKDFHSVLDLEDLEVCIYRDMCC